MSCRNISGQQEPTDFVLPNTIVFETNDTYTSSPGTQYLEVYVIGGGGGGGGGGAVGRGGCGGGAATPSVGFYGPGTYSITIGSGGPGNLVGNNGLSGTESNFGSGLLIGGGANGGENGDGTFPLRPGGAGSAHVTAMYSLGSEPGQAGEEYTQGGCGGSNYFGTGGRAPYNRTVAVAGDNATGYGAGGAGGSVGASGGDGSNGAIIIIEHF